MITCIIVGAGSRGKYAYAPYIAQSGVMEIVGVAESDDVKREGFKTEYKIPDNMCFKSYEDLFSHEKLADACFICTNDKSHTDAAIMAIKCGYHVMLENPVSASLSELDGMHEALRGYKGVFISGNVLRYTPFIKKIKETIDSGVIGDVITISHNENEGYWHHAHSYVRGEWSNSSSAVPMIVAKAAHDFDIIHHLIGAKCISVASYGGNLYFTSENAPKDAPARCTDGCPHKDVCEYNAIKLYTDGPARYFVNKFGCEDTDQAIINELKTNPYGRCVYRCDNNVCDHQVASLLFENGATATLTVSAFSKESTRTVKVMGTKGEIGGCMEKGIITLKTFSDDEEKTFHIDNDGTRHCGGDGELVRCFAELIANGEAYVDESVFHSHRMAFSAEKSRITGETQYIHKQFNTDATISDAQIALLSEIRITILNKLEREWTLEQMATLAGYSTSRFSYLYKKVFNISPISDLLHARIERAKELLLNENLTAKQLAIRTGFSTINNFSYTFKKYVGITPSEYKLKYKKHHRKR